MAEEFVPIRDLAVIGDRRTCAYLDKKGSVVWYCPSRFDNPSLFAHLLDPTKGGAWRLRAEGLGCDRREYESDSTMLRTRFAGEGGELWVEDWMPLDDGFTGICRQLSASPVPVEVELEPRPGYAQEAVTLVSEGNAVRINNTHYFYGSHPLESKGETIRCQVPAREEAWFLLSDQPLDRPGQQMEKAKAATREEWRKINRHITYHGPYEQQVRNSLRVLRLMTYGETGGIIAAGTTSLPEIPGGPRNYDYRYVWLRDAAMIVSALTRAGSDGVEERKFLSFICSAMRQVEEPVVPFFTVEAKPAPGVQELPLLGYAHSRPVRIGNNANHQLQLDAISNVLLAAKLIYGHFDTREHWETVSQLADYLVAHWQEEDHGIWEETPRKQYTSSKVVAAVSLEYIAEYCEDRRQRERWEEAARRIREYVKEKCLTQEGAYAVFAGSEDVDITSILFPIWSFTDPDTPAMLKTVEVLERDYCRQNLFYRHLVELDSGEEGAFLAGTFWMAQYWVMRRDWEKFHRIMRAALAYMNDVGMMPEEAGPGSGDFLGNIPQTFVHASLIGAVVDYKNALEGEE